MLRLESGAQLRLLDAALLLGHVEASAVLTELCGQARPLRICEISEIVKIRCMRLIQDFTSTQYVEVHMKAGAIANAEDLCRYHGYDCFADGEDFSYLELVVVNGHVNLAKLIQVIDPAASFESDFKSYSDKYLAYDSATQSCHVKSAILEAMSVLGMRFGRLRPSFDPDHQKCLVGQRCQRCKSHDHANQILDVGASSLLYLAIYLGDRCGVSTLVLGGADLTGEIEVSALLNEQLLDGEFLPGAVPWPCCHRTARMSEPLSNIPPAMRVETVELALSAALQRACARMKQAASTVSRVGLWQLNCSSLETALVDLILDFAAELPQGLQCLHSHFIVLIGRNPRVR
ncbi:unnamed protein product [Polarella glacialis]|uniref:Uncharacterized protein n=1 Tax=Polarella glacialis TaxID=89957 RepID=A0A813LBY6_POLGL|nr:unnamed protein product [Polarella glacialis]